MNMNDGNLSTYEEVIALYSKMRSSQKGCNIPSASIMVHFNSSRAPSSSGQTNADCEDRFALALMFCGFGCRGRAGNGGADFERQARERTSRAHGSMNGLILSSNWSTVTGL
jgi:hypothetical protein